MAGPGGGPPRRSHTKSRKGCETCKRRHIRCDESFPQCRNCTKHSVRCPYMDMPALEEHAPTPEKADLLWTPEIEGEIELWQRTGVFPFPQLNLYPAPNPQFFSLEDLRLIHHVASISMELSMQDAGNFTIWTGQIPLFLKIGSIYGFVMHALLALSATHIAWLTDDQIVSQMAYEHRGIALKDLQGAIGAFSRENSDAVLAASLLLSWQATEWRGWTQLMHGTSSVIDAMQPWKNESQFGEFIAEQSTFPTAPPSPVPNKRFSQPRKQDLDALQRAFGQLQVVETVLKDRREDPQAIAQLMSFIRGVRKVTPNNSAAQRFEMLNPLRTWLFWLPVMYLQQPRSSPYSLVILAYYYTMALVVEPIFPEVGAAYFGSLSIGPIEEIARRLFSVNVSQTSGDDLRTPLALMEYPIDMVSKFRTRMGFTQPERTASFPTFEGVGFHHGMVEHHPGHYPHGNNPAFSYSQEHLMPHHSEPPPPAISSLALDPFTSSPGHYLEIPSPAAFAGYHSPAGSSYGEIAYSDGGDEYLYEGQTSGSVAGYAGTFEPNIKVEGCLHSSPQANTPVFSSSSLQPFPQQYHTPQHYSPLPSPPSPLAFPSSSAGSKPPSPKGKGRQ